MNCFLFVTAEGGINTLVTAVEGFRVVVTPETALSWLGGVYCVCLLTVGTFVYVERSPH